MADSYTLLLDIINIKSGLCVGCIIIHTLQPIIGYYMP